MATTIESLRFFRCGIGDWCYGVNPEIFPDMVFSASEPGTTILEETSVKDRTTAPWEVVVYDDPVNYMGYVVLVFQRVFGYSSGVATKLMREVHELGRSVVWTGEKEKAEHYTRQLQAHQLRAAMERGEGGA